MQTVECTNIFNLLVQARRSAHLLQPRGRDSAILLQVLRNATDLPLGDAIRVRDLFGIFPPEEGCGDLFALVLCELWWHCRVAEKRRTVAQSRLAEQLNENIR